MATKDEVQSFLQNFKAKLGVWGVIYRDDRGKNTQALLTLDITPAYREKILRELMVNDFSEGPLLEQLYGGSDMWVFGKRLKSGEVYIKITVGFCNKPVICISFHPAEYTISYPFK